MVTMEDVAKAANVSRATVSRVLSNHPSIKMETRSHVMYWVKSWDMSRIRWPRAWRGIGPILSECCFQIYPIHCMHPL